MGSRAGVTALRDMQEDDNECHKRGKTYNQSAKNCQKVRREEPRSLEAVGRIPEIFAEKEGSEHCVLPGVTR